MALYGATYPGQIWKESMLKLIEGKEIKNDFEKDDSAGLIELYAHSI